jgi:hypothetical protein
MRLANKSGREPTPIHQWRAVFFAMWSPVLDPGLLPETRLVLTALRSARWLHAKISRNE